MDIESIIAQLEESADNREYKYHCCGCTFDNLYEFRKHIFEQHQEEYGEIEPFFHRKKPKLLSKEELNAKVKEALKRKKMSSKGKQVKGKEKVDYSRQPRAWLIYNHNGSKK